MAVARQLAPEEASALLGEAVGASIEREVAVRAAAIAAAKAQRAAARNAEAQDGGGVQRLVQMMRHRRYDYVGSAQSVRPKRPIE
jgi:hypothetical protein